ncbi:MAG: hypothetical protein SPD95_08925 [Candidatus Faecousia sp.]|nr:hypothetical protein [Candidatus Faecousia sp.]
MTLITYPLDDCDYSADDAALFHCTRTSGIFASDDFSFSVSGADNTVRVSPGIAWMRINKFKGLVAALKNEVSVDLGLPDSVYSRIDRVVLQYNANTRDTTVVVKRGVPRSNPLPPDRSTEDALYELHLLEVLRKPAAAAVKQENVTDLRFDSSCCGLMADSVTKVDTSAINAQVMALVNELRTKLSEVEEQTYYASKEFVTTTAATATLTAAGWVGSGPYTQTIAVQGLTDGRRVMVTPKYGSNADDNIAMREACGCVSYAQRSGSNVTITCLEDKPAVDISIIVEMYV